MFVTKLRQAVSSTDAFAKLVCQVNFYKNTVNFSRVCLAFKLYSISITYLCFLIVVSKQIRIRALLVLIKEKTYNFIFKNETIDLYDYYKINLFDVSDTMLSNFERECSKLDLLFRSSLLQGLDN